MRPIDKTAFSDAARNKFWILVRVTNVASLNYIGKSDYAPKQIDCKAKTAISDVSPYVLNGLVVDPNIHPGAYPGKLADAKKYWQQMDFSKGKYKVNDDKKSEHYGCLMCNEKFIHGDYDLYDIVDISQPQRNLVLVSELEGMEHRVSANLWQVQGKVNSRIGSPMIQHGGEAQFKEHTEQPIDAFGPNGEVEQIKNLNELRGWYEKKFRGRITLADSHGKPLPNNIKMGDPFKVIQGGKK